MSTRFSHILLLSGSLVLACSACNNNTGTKTNGPIVLGDSSSIVTEEDPHKLKDMVIDLEPTIPPAEAEPEQKPTADTTATTPPKQENAATPQPAAPKQENKPLPDVAGLKANFKDVGVLIPNLDAKLAGRPNLEHANGAVFTLNGGNINGNQLRISGNVTKVAMRYQTTATLKTEYGTFPIDGLGTTTDWEQMKGNGTYQITGLDARSLEYADAGPSAIRNAVERALHRHRLSRRKIAEVMDDFPHVRSANQKPLSVVLRSVMWKIDGKDANGRMFSKQVRIDIPL
jgi:hypothetical protein